MEKVEFRLGDIVEGEVVKKRQRRLERIKRIAKWLDENQLMSPNRETYICAFIDYLPYFETTDEFRAEYIKLTENIGSSLLLEIGAAP